MLAGDVDLDLARDLLHSRILLDALEAEGFHLQSERCLAVRGSSQREHAPRSPRLGSPKDSGSQKVQHVGEKGPGSRYITVTAVTFTRSL